MPSDTLYYIKIIWSGLMLKTTTTVHIVRNSWYN